MFANRNRGAMKCNGEGKRKKKKLNREAVTMTVATFASLQKIREKQTY